MFGKQEIKLFLEEKNIPFEWVEHKAVFTIEEMEELGLESMDEIAKNLFLRDQKGKRHFLIVIR
ncbi:MAG: prolyl-tRNA synthetase associated domain-containing protein, partial [Anaerotignum sp.]|nr:prolyl-tRNA synthetase associated domain-containing protein [Anaerotignum sp.]